MGKITEVTVSAAQATIDLPVSAAAYRHLLVTVEGRGDAAAAAVILLLALNGDTTAANYASSDATNPRRAGTLYAASAPAGEFNGIEIAIPNYTTTTQHKSWRATSTDTTVAGGQDTASGFWTPAADAAVTDVTLSLSAGNFAAGTVATLYGVDSQAGGGAPLTATTWAAQKPASDGAVATGSYEMGQRFYVDGACHCAGVTFYKPSTETGATHTVNLWDDTSALLGTATTTSETASGWQTALFATPIALTGLTYYRATWGTNAARWEQGGALPIGSGPLHITQDCYNATHGAFPTSALGSIDRYVSPIITVP